MQRSFSTFPGGRPGAGLLLLRAAVGGTLMVLGFASLTSAGSFSRWFWAAGFLAGLSTGRDFPAAARLGNAVAACGIQAAGATSGVKPLAATRAAFSL